jgi:hypothetical protein
MDDRKDSSLLFSLKELQDHETRVEAERKASIRRREEAARTAQMERERVLRLAKEQERAEEERRRAEAERARLDEAARRAAAEQAIVERERIEARARIDAEREAERRRHELELARMGAARSTRSAAVLAIGSMVLTSAVFLGAYFGFVAPTHRDALDSLRAAANTERERADAADHRLQGLKDERKLLVQRVGEILHELDQAKPRTVPVPVAPVHSAPGRGGKGPVDGTGVCNPNAAEGDPFSCDKRLGH